MAKAFKNEAHKTVFAPSLPPRPSPLSCTAQDEPQGMVSQCQTYQQSGWGQELPEELEETVPQEALTANHHLNVLNKAISTCEDMNRCMITTSSKVASVQWMDSFAKSFSGATRVQLQVKGMQPPHLRKQFPGIQRSLPCVAQCGSQVFNVVEELPRPMNMHI